ncbi:uncharacterized protein EI90DRAFT_1477769 [Cantharellus anzutake]|uniref:uncharacterized protein n=1 Tax=Cantharellus anzutake TaxID=1750568 RepID=UPI001903808E|nr:uncharacterized protein EI90DRAFT_1477769 [Cantharellus anzutake]KAF8328800.1 hypothetical protein EI90DRAFT_1477769 [Cantharellus anzutake]
MVTACHRKGDWHAHCLACLTQRQPFCYSQVLHAPVGDIRWKRRAKALRSLLFSIVAASAHAFPTLWRWLGGLNGEDANAAYNSTDGGSLRIRRHFSTLPFHLTRLRCTVRVGKSSSTGGGCIGAICGMGTTYMYSGIKWFA